MSSQTIVSGYIETDPKYDENNAATLTQWRYDDIYPFTNIFAQPRRGYTCSIVSLGGSFKTLIENWAEWECRFEELLRALFAISAHVYVEDEVTGRFAIEYFCEEAWMSDIPCGKRRWRKWKVDIKNGKENRTEIIDITRQ